MFRSKPKTFHYYPKSVTFGFHTAEDIRRISVVEIKIPQTFDVLSHPVPEGLYDPRMGPSDEKADENCATCGLKMVPCPGHYGHIELPLPAFHPLFHRDVVKILKLSCPTCKRFKFSETRKAVLCGQLELLSHGLVTEAQEILESVHLSDEEEDEEDEGRKTKQKKKNGKKNQLAGIQNEAIRKHVQEIVQRVKEEGGASSAQGDNPPTRSVEALRQAYVNEFLKKSQSKATCGECKTKGWKSIMLYDSRIVYSVKSDGVTAAFGGDDDEDENGVKAPKQVTTPGKRSRKSVGATPVLELNASEARDFLREIWMHDKEIFSYLFPVLAKMKSEHPTDVFFLEVLPVIPPKFRPVAFAAGHIVQHGQSMILREILQDKYAVSAVLWVQQNPDKPVPPDTQRFLDSLDGKTTLEKLQTAWHEMQKHVDMLVDTSTGKDASNTSGFKQVMERKEGLLRMHMMGKRVNYAARSVITPDPFLEVDEVGVPDVFAKRLTYPTPVTSWNVYEMRELVRNGPDVYPGANYIEEENGKLIYLKGDNLAAREEVAKTLLTPSEAAIRYNKLEGGRNQSAQRPLFKPKIVHRHLQTGDIMLINRQPTLHKPSIMAHKARVLMGEKTLRLHYANCKAYNADFDGDEMNAHFPQDEVGRAEAYNIVAVPHQYLVPKDGTPLSGLIQDHMISGVKLTIRGQFFNRSDYQQLVFAGLGGRPYSGATKLLPPAILKPVKLWSGKQVLSTIILNLTPKDRGLINMDSTAKISSKDWQTGVKRPWKAGGTELTNPISMSESEVIFRHGELLCGVLDKMHYGSTSYSLVHAFSELYGGEYSCRLLSSFSRLFTSFLQLRGFTLGVEDILVTPKADKKRKKIISRVKAIGNSTAARAVGLDPELAKGEEGLKLIRQRLNEAHLSRTPLKWMTVDREYKTETDKITNEVNKACIPGGLHRQFPDNNLSLMIQSGAKGSSVNAMQISCLLGQIELEGKRPPLMISGRSLPSFVAYDTSPRAGGFISGRFMTGIRPQEFFYHCMAGREGLIDTAVKTSRSGYLQRCLIKNLEGVSVAYDHTVRDSDGSVLQFLYGEDGLDICKSQYLNDKGIPFLVSNRNCIRLADKSAYDEEDQKKAKSAMKLVKRWLKRHGSLKKTERTTPFLNFTAQVREELEEMEGSEHRVGRSLQADELERRWRAMPASEKQAYTKKLSSPPDPVNAHYPFARYLDVLDEQLDEMMARYLGKPDRDPDIGRDEMRRLIYSKSVAAACDPGEPVGVLAAQSIGEPSTQMTLNTFHFAGRGEMNVTLGIPRLREILTVASTNIKTPSMDIPLLKKGPKGLKQAEKLKLLLTRVTLADVLESVEVTEGLSLGEGRKRIYGLTFKFLPRSCYKDRFCVKPNQVLHYFEKKFVFGILLPNMRKEAEAQSSQSLFVSKSAAQSRKAAKGGEEEENVDEGEAPAETAGDKAVGGDVEDSDSETEAAGEDLDRESAQKHPKRGDECEYEEDEEDARDGVTNDDEGFEEDVEEPRRERAGESASDDEEKTGTGEAQQGEEEEEELSAEAEEAIEERKNFLLDQDKSDWISEYEFDYKTHLSCRLTLAVSLSIQKVDMSSALKRWAESAVVHQVPNIKRAFVVPPKSENDDIVIKTDGVNINAMFKHSKILDLRRLYCNDIHAVAKHYGVEAASRVIVQEVRNVFKVYGITVDPRHLSLVASFMTSGGGYRAFSRLGMGDCTSPLQQMSFETSIEFLKRATLQGKTDYLKSPSSRLIMGIPGLEGTGSFGLLSKLSLGNVY